MGLAGWVIRVVNFSKLLSSPTSFSIDCVKKTFPFPFSPFAQFVFVCFSLLDHCRCADKGLAWVRYSDYKNSYWQHLGNVSFYLKVPL